MPKPTLLTVKQAREKLGLDSNQGVHYLVEQGKLKVAEYVDRGKGLKPERLFDPAEVERVKKERLKDLLKQVKELKST